MITDSQIKEATMTWIALLLIVIAGIAEHFKDLSEEGKLKGYWDKNHPPMTFTKYLHDKNCFVLVDSTAWQRSQLIIMKTLWWRVHWLQGPKWDWIPVWIRQYLSFRDGWHLLKFISLNSFAVAVVLLAGLPWWWYLAIRFAFSSPETILRWYETRN